MAIAVGDIHGCLSPLRALLEKVPADEELVFLGDYVDRGPASAGVLEFLAGLAQERPCRFLMGNHEELMRNAIEQSEEIPLWLYNGGDATLRSFHLGVHDWSASRDRAAPLRAFVEFYPRLALYHEDDTAIYVHAGLDLFVPRLEDQDPQMLLWIREKFFLNADRWQGKPIVFGHTPTQSMGLPPGRIFQSHKLYGIDTGCVYGGYLTALDTRTFRLYQQRSDHLRY